MTRKRAVREKGQRLSCAIHEAVAHCGSGVKMSESPAYIGGRLDRGASCYGEDNHYVYGELLEMSSQAIDTLTAEGVI